MSYTKMLVFLNTKKLRFWQNNDKVLNWLNLMDWVKLDKVICKDHMSI